MKYRVEFECTSTTYYTTEVVVEATNSEEAKTLAKANLLENLDRVWEEQSSEESIDVSYVEVDEDEEEDV